MGTVLTRPSPDDTNVETFSLIWLDATVNTSPENIKSQSILRESINQLKTFDNGDECIKYIEYLSANDRIILISSGNLGRSIVPRIHELRQIFSIYIYCMNKEAHEQWTKKFIKVIKILILIFIIDLFLCSRSKVFLLF
jgi:hypothetical protein